jgi:hypothetical protein
MGGVRARAVVGWEKIATAWGAAKLVLLRATDAARKRDAGSQLMFTPRIPVLFCC